jgi:hypothetical protein
LVVGGRYGALLALTVWIGLALGALIMVPALFRSLERPQAHEMAAPMLARADRVLLGALALLIVSLGVLSSAGHAWPPSHLLGTLAVMAGLRLIGSFAVGPAARALRTRVHDANAPASNDERRAFERLHATSLLLLALEVGLGCYALFVIS